MTKTINLVDANGNWFERNMTPEEEFEFQQMALEEYEADMEGEE